MGNVLAIVWSLPFLLGVAAGTVGYHCLAKGRCWWLNRYRPRPDGKPWYAPGVSRTVWGGLIAAGAVLYVLSQAQQTHDETVKLSEETRLCQADLIANITENRKIQRTNDALSVQQRDLFAAIDDAGALWIDRLLNPPGDVAKRDPQDPRRQQYNVDVTRVYYDRVGKYRQQVAAITDEQERLTREQAANALPSPHCGE